MNKPPLDGVLLAKIENLMDDYDHVPNEPNIVQLTADADEANVITSISSSDPRNHKLVLDIDIPAVLIPSSTSGHFHLLIDKELTWSKYEKLLDALATAEVITPEYADHSKRKGFTAVRLPWIKKGRS